METRTFSVAVVLACVALVCRGEPSVDPPSGYPGALRRAIAPAPADSADYISGDAPPSDSAWPGLLPIYKPAPLVDPSQFVQMKATLLKNLFGTGVGAGAARSPAARSAGPPPKASKYASGGASKSKGSSSSSTQSQKAPAAESAPTDWSNPASWMWPPPSDTASQNAPAPAPAPAATPAPKSPAPSKYNAYPTQAPWTPPTEAPTPAAPTDKKTPLLEALLIEFLTDQQQASARVARAPLGTAPTPSPYLSELLDSLNITAPEVPVPATPTIEPAGFWFPDLVANPGGLKPYAVDPASMITKKTKFLSDLFAQKVLFSPVAPLAARDVDPTDYSTKVSSYLSKIIDPTSASAKRSSGVQDIPEDERVGLRKKRAIDDETEIPASDAPTAEGEVPTPDVVTLANDLAIVKQNILVQLDLMQKARLAESKALRAAAKAAKAQAVLAALSPGLAAITPTSPPPNLTLPVPLSEYQQRIALLSTLFGSLAEAQRNLTGAAAPGTLTPDQLFLSAVNDKVGTILLKSAQAQVASKVARSSGSYQQQRWRGQQDYPESSSPQSENENETSRRQKAAVPLVAAVFAPETHNYHNRQPMWWN